MFKLILHNNLINNARRDREGTRRRSQKNLFNVKSYVKHRRSNNNKVVINNNCVQKIHELQFVAFFFNN